MKPYIICYMLSSVDGRIECSVLDSLIGERDYDEVKEELKGDAWLCGRVTMEIHHADPEPFLSKTNQSVGVSSVHVAQKADSYAICADTFGKLNWASNMLEGEPIICVLSQQVTDDYLEMLRQKEISYIVAGQEKIDLARAVELLGEHFGTRRLLLEGGGHINAGFLEAGLIDELCLLIAPGIDGRQGIPTIFEGISPEKNEAVSLKLQNVRQFPSGAVCLRYILSKML
ncbi:MAG: dihydrofolate reductase family protein [Planctomycetia bacterium]|nr:dihydrofolate reductase family protein [Planctomycetia bacterium]